MESFKQPEKIVDAIINKVGNKIVLALPLGLGKANHIANEFVRRAQNDQSIDLHIFTALTLDRPRSNSALMMRFLSPALLRLFGDYPALTYTHLLRDGNLPSNIKVNEFFLLAGQWLGNPQAQQNFVPANYTHVISYLIEQGVNVIAQLVAKNNAQYSLSCNTDLTTDLLEMRAQGDVDFIFASQVNSELPFMPGSALIKDSHIDFMLDSSETDFELFSLPKRPVSLADQAIGLHAARLVQDGGTLQIGIGSIGDAVTKALILRHENNEEFRKIIVKLSYQQEVEDSYFKPFVKGLYGVSEMFVDGFLHLANHGILKRKIDGAVLHAGFFVDCKDFYQKLRDMSEKERARFEMMPISFTNELYSDEQSKRKARVKACFINNAMMATLRGAVVSDALEDGRVVSGVGGQYNFVAQSFALKDARFIITLNATRRSKGKTLSNIVWTYGHETIPWHLRDTIITEYGIAFLRGKSEKEAVKAMLAISDSRFQQDLLEQAKKSGKIEKDWQIDECYKNNFPQKLDISLGAARTNGLLPAFPFGTDFTEIERRLIPAMDFLKDYSHSKLAITKLLFSSFFKKELIESDKECLKRLNIEKPRNLREFFYNKLIITALNKTRDSVANY